MAIEIDGTEGITFPDGKQQTGGTPDGLEEGTTYKRILAAFANAINNESRLPTALGTADINLIGALSKVADKKLFVNAAGTGFEYASGIAILSSSRDLSLASGDVAYTGLGFRPSVILFISVTGSVAGFAVGLDRQAARFAVDAAGNYTTAYSIQCIASSGNYQGAFIKSMDANGYTLTWAKTGSPSGTGRILALAIR